MNQLCSRSATKPDADIDVVKQHIHGMHLLAVFHGGRAPGAVLGSHTCQEQF